jgi:excisionase family DNA binding protein
MYLTINQACHKLNISRQTLYDWQRYGLPIERDGSRPRIEATALEQWRAAFVPPKTGRPTGRRAR